MSESDRFARLADRLDVRAGQQILEIGGGRGALAEVICDRLGTGRFVGCDRSAVAVAAARKRNRRHVEAGLAEFHELELRGLDPAQLGSFDTVVAVNVNLFWTGSRTPELAVLFELLEPEGRLWIAYDYQPVGPAEQQRLTEVIGDRLRKSGFESAVLDPGSVAGAFVLSASRTVDGTNAGTPSAGTPPRARAAAATSAPRSRA